MEHSVVINGKKYIHTNLVRDNQKVRESLNALAQKTFGLSFEWWYENGYWQNGNIPHVLIHEGEVVANISVNLIHMNYCSTEKQYIQLGTVMTDTAYHNQHLSQYLMQVILNEQSEKTDDIFLFANDSVLDFYPKFGFHKVKEYQYTLKLITTSTQTARKLDVTNEHDLKLLRGMAHFGNPYSKFQMINIDSMLMFYCLQFMQDSVYYSEIYNAIIIAEVDDESMTCYEVFSNGVPTSLSNILSTVTKKQPIKITLGFTPMDVDGFEIIEHKHKEDDSTLFMLNKKENLLMNTNLMFPLLSHT